MTERKRYRPFTDDENVKVRFDAAPLELVLCQVRWPQLSTLQGDISDSARSFGNLLTGFPLFSAGPEMVMELTPSGFIQAPAGVLYQWSTPDRATSVTLTNTFVTLATKRYEGYEAFSGQLRDVLTALEATMRIPLVERVGVRYVNRITDPAKISHIGDLVRPEILGYQVLTAATSEVRLVQALTQSLFDVGDGSLQARSGILPPGETLDPTIGILESPSWILDIDSFQQSEALFDLESVLAQASKLSDSAYDFFKLVILEGFLDTFEGRKI